MKNNQPKCARCGLFISKKDIAEGKLVNRKLIFVDETIKVAYYCKQCEEKAESYENSNI